MRHGEDGFAPARQSALPSLSPERIAQFDADLAAILAEKFPEPMTVLHRIYAAIGAAP